ncbi:MAG: hypothetical protein R3F59_29590 [Myxococcota bacterium]
MVDTAALTLLAMLQVAILFVLVCQLALQLWRRERPAADTAWVDVPARAISGTLPCGGAYEVVSGMREGEPVLASGVVVIDSDSEVWRVFEVWARTDHGWVQLQPGAGEGMFRNALVAGVRLVSLRLWLAPLAGQPDESGLRAASGLLVPAALLLTRVRSTRELDGTPPPARRRTAASGPPMAAGREAHTPVD